MKHGYEDNYCDELGDGVYANDTFAFYNSTDWQTNVTQKDLVFFYSYFLSYEAVKNVCGVIGFGLKQKYTDYNLEPLLKNIKKNGLIAWFDLYSY